MKIEYHSKALKFLQKQEAKINIRIITAINKLPDGDVRKLEGYNNKYRLRVGGYRVIFSVYDGIESNNQHKVKRLKVWDIDNRGDVY